MFGHFPLGKSLTTWLLQLQKTNIACRVRFLKNDNQAGTTLLGKILHFINAPSRIGKRAAHTFVPQLVCQFKLSRDNCGAYCTTMDDNVQSFPDSSFIFITDSGGQSFEAKREADAKGRLVI